MVSQKNLSAGVQPSTIFINDNLPIMRGMADNSIDLIATDPPFNSHAHYSADHASANFSDIWKLTEESQAALQRIADSHPPLAEFIGAAAALHSAGLKAYLIMMAGRLIEMQRILKPSGSIYLHCDKHASHYLKILLDGIFGAENFRNHLVWFYPDTPGRAKNRYAAKHDDILFYSKTDDYIFNADAIRVPIKAESKNRYKTARRLNGRLYVGGKAATIGKIPEDVVQIPSVKGNSKEATRYPTQKPLALYEMLVSASSRQGGLVLDPFCGCSTTCIAAEKLQRKWIGIDKNPVNEFLSLRLKREAGVEAGDIPLVRYDVPCPTQ